VNVLKLDKETIQREISSLFASRQQALDAVQQLAGAISVYQKLLKDLDAEEAKKADEELPAEADEQTSQDEDDA
jgi:hypothetical protein